MERGSSGIVFVHGIVGNNKIFEFLRERVPEKWECRFVKLEGHGGDALSFSRASMKQWKKQVAEAVGELATSCDRILGVGHSMGCLLLINQATENRLSGLFLMNPPLRIRLRISLLSNAIKVAMGMTKHDPVAEAAKEAYGVSLDFNPLHYYGWPQRYFELFREIGFVRSHLLGKVGCPVRALLSSKDEMVSLASKAVLQKMPIVVTSILPDSTHYYYSTEGKPAICREFEALIGML